MACALLSLAFQTRPRFRAGVDLVEVDAVVVDGQGRIVPDLSRDDFEVREDGRLVSVVSFVPVAAETTPARVYSRFVVLLLDDLITDPSRTTNIKNIARMFAGRMGPRDTMAVLPLNGGAATTSTSRTDVLAAIDRFQPFGASILRQPSDHLFDTILHLTEQLASVRVRRKTLVYVGNANAFDPSEDIGRQGGNTYSPRWSDALRGAARANVSVYVVDPFGLTGRQYDGAKAFADETGGDAFVNSNFFERNVDEIWAEAGRYYLLGYESPAQTAPSSKTHRIAVTIRRSGMHVRARRTR